MGWGEVEWQVPSWLRPSGEHQGHKHEKDVAWLGVPHNQGLELAAEIREEPFGAVSQVTGKPGKNAFLGFSQTMILGFCHLIGHSSNAVDNSRSPIQVL